LPETIEEFFGGGNVNARMARGFLWGAVATILMTCTHAAIWAVEGRLTAYAFATQAMPAVIITKMFGPGLPVTTHLLLAVLLHLGYGGFWGAILFALTPRVTFWKGVGMGAFLWVGAHLFLQPLMGRSIFTSGSAQILSGLWFSIATHFTYGASLGLLGTRGERSAQIDRASAEKPETQLRSPKPAASAR
jgi:hypothetical protein